MNRPSACDLVLVGFRPADTRAALRFCDRVFDRDRGARRLLVSNRPGLAQELAPLARGWQSLEGSNRLAEFSGWQEGLDHLRQGSANDRGIVFVNDSVCTHRHFTFARARAFRHALRASEGPRIIGFRDIPDHRVFSAALEFQIRLTIAELELDAWTSTYCFALTAGALRALDHELCDPVLVSQCVPGGTDEKAFFDRLSPHLDRHLRHWLFEGGWYGSGRLSSANASHLLLKARCIAAELLLSARCRSAGVEAIDPFHVQPRLERMDRLLRRWRRNGLRLIGR